jgi:hypothetical protein
MQANQTRYSPPLLWQSLDALPSNRGNEEDFSFLSIGYHGRSRWHMLQRAIESLGLHTPVIVSDYYRVMNDTWPRSKVVPVGHSISALTAAKIKMERSPIIVVDL